MYQILIVDDEEPARDKVLRFLQKSKLDFQYRVCRHGQEALETLQQESFDLMFLDVQMPVMSGLELIQTVPSAICPPIVFVTAYDQYAIQAFEMHALEYLLKPYDFERFSEALHHVLRLIDAQKYPAVNVRLLLQEWQQAQPAYPTKLWVQQGKKTIPLSVNDVEYVAADGNYVQVYTRHSKYLIRKSLVELEQELTPHGFVRIHRSHVINLEEIQEIFPKSHGDLFVRMRSGAKLTISRRYKENVIP